LPGSLAPWPWLAPPPRVRRAEAAQVLPRLALGGSGRALHGGARGLFQSRGLPRL